MNTENPFKDGEERLLFAKVLDKYSYLKDIVYQYETKKATGVSPYREV